MVPSLKFQWITVHECLTVHDVRHNGDTENMAHTSRKREKVAISIFSRFGQTAQVMVVEQIPSCQERARNLVLPMPRPW
eukprot:6184589-Pleurochrysis_carterae.AAC.2